jgi:hypothetical protein
VKSTGLSGVNPVAAEIATNPETSDYTSIKQSVDILSESVFGRVGSRPQTDVADVDSIVARR